MKQGCFPGIERCPAVFAQLMGQSVLVTEGQTWQRQRRMLQPAFTPKKVAGYARLMTDAARSALDEVLPPEQHRATVNVDELWTTVAMDVILRTLFSSRAPDDARAAGQAVQVLGAAAMQEMMRPFALPAWLPLPGRRAKVQALEMMRELVGATSTSAVTPRRMTHAKTCWPCCWRCATSRPASR